jgi:cysteine synthase A
MSQREWVAAAIRKIEADFNRSADTHLIPLALPGFEGIDLYLKDESSHPTGSLKHRLARSLFLYALANGWLREGRPVIEASSGSTAVSKPISRACSGLPFIAVIPATTSPEKIAAIEFHGGRCHLVERACDLNCDSEKLARETGGHFMDQFTYAERATDWRANNNIAESIFKQMAEEPSPVPEWIVCSPGTGGTAATLGRYVSYRRHDTRILCADPEVSVFFDGYKAAVAGEQDWRGLTCSGGSRVEGIGRPRVEPSFIPTSVDAMVKVPDALSLAAMRHVSRQLGRRVGGSTGTNFIGVLQAAQWMREAGHQGSIVSILCDSGERYAQSYYDPAWYARQGIDVDGADAQLAAAVAGQGCPNCRGAAWKRCSALVSRAMLDSESRRAWLDATYQYAAVNASSTASRRHRARPRCPSRDHPGAGWGPGCWRGPGPAPAATSTQITNSRSWPSCNWLAPRSITSNGYHSWASLNVPPCCSTACSCWWRGASSPASHSAAIQVSSAGLADNASDRAGEADATAARPSM